MTTMTAGQVPGREVRVDPDANKTRAVRALVDLAGARVLEIGAGDGRMTWRLAEATSEVVALDPLRDDIERAIADTPAQLRSRVRFVAADATAYRYPRSRFDVAVLSYSLC